MFAKSTGKTLTDADIKNMDYPDFVEMYEENATVGDINSDKKGSAARFNADKDPLELIPVRQHLLLLWGEEWDKMSDECYEWEMSLRESMHCLAKFQEGDDSALDDAIMWCLSQTRAAARVLKKVTEKKYPLWNWAKGMPWSVCFGCAMRHAHDWIDKGEMEDAESGEHHMAHYLCNLIFLSHYVRHYKEGDDRPKIFYGNEEHDKE